MTTFTDTWNAAFNITPANVDVISAGAGKIRQLKVAVQERLAVDHSAVGDANDGAHKKVTLIEQAANPSTAANTGYLYTKDVAGVTELFYKDSAGTVRQITTAGAINADTATQNLTLVAGQATTSGTTKDFTGIPSWVNRITIMLVGVSITGVGYILIQIGDAGGIEATGYTSTYWDTVSSGAITTAFILHGAEAAGSVLDGAFILDRYGSNTWVGHGVLSSAGRTAMSSGSKSTSAALDRVRILTDTGTFDAGSVSISYE